MNTDRAGTPLSSPRVPQVGHAPRATRSAGGTPLVPRAADVIQLTKPRITGLVVVTAAAGFLAAGGGGGSLLLGHLLFGTALLAGGTNALNQYLEREADGRMVRTRGRPLPAARIRPVAAAAAGGLLVGAGTAHLLLMVNALTAALGLVSAVLYAAVYTPLKRTSTLSLPVGAVPGALPILGGWTAARGGIGAGGLALFAILFLWQIPHFLALGWRHRHDYARAGFSVLPVADPDGSRTGSYAVLSALALVPVSLMPVLVGGAGWPYAAAAGFLGIVYVARAGRFATRQGTRGEGLFRISLWYLPLLLAVLVLDVRLISLSGPGAESLPALNASLNGVAALSLAAGFWFIRRGREERHRTAMLVAAAASAVFLTSYATYHLAVGSVAFGGEGWVRGLYYGVLISHAVLAIAVLPLALVTLSRVLAGRRGAHRRIARWTFPLWLYVSITGLVVYYMLYRM